MFKHLSWILGILLAVPFMFGGDVNAQCDVFIEPGSVEIIDNGTGVQFRFDITNNSAVEYNGGTLELYWTLNSSAPLWEIDFTNNTTASPIAPGETRSIKTPWFDFPNLPSWFPNNPGTAGANGELWVDALEWPFWSANPAGFNGSWSPMVLKLDGCSSDIDGDGVLDVIYDQNGDLYYGPTNSDCPNENGDQFCDCEIDFIDFNHNTYEAILEVNGWQNCATPLNNGAIGDIDKINSIVLGMHIPDWDYGWGDCVGADDDTYPGWTFALFTGINVNSPETITIDVGGSSASVIPCWIEIFEDPDLPCREIVIWQINFSQTATIQDFPEEGWASNPQQGYSTAEYPDITIENNRINYCNTPNAFPLSNGLDGVCIDNNPVFEYDIMISNNGLDTLFNYCVEIPELGYNQCFNGYNQPLYYIAPNEGQFLGTVQIPENITNFTVNVYNVEDELDEFYFDNSVDIDIVASEFDDLCEVEGCTDPEADNFDPLATIDDGSCIFNNFIDAGIDTLTSNLGGCFGEPMYWEPIVNVGNYGDTPITEMCVTFDILSDGLPDDTICFDNINLLPGEVMLVQFPQTTVGTSPVTVSVGVYEVNGNNQLHDFGNDDNFNNNQDVFTYQMWCYDCIDPEADNYNEYATDQFIPNNCEYLGCTDTEADNYDSTANVDDGSCEYLGCTDNQANNYDATANVDDGSCEYLGCTDTEADNYDSTANVDDGSCEYLGCTDTEADNYDSTANVDDGSCEYLGCTDPEAVNYDNQANVEDGSCEYEGCTDPEANNYDPTVTYDDGSCEYLGCTDTEADNYDATANVDDGSCEYLGCTDTNAFNYDPQANVEDGSCEYEGCTDPEALNYDPNATIDDGNCIFLPVIDECDEVNVFAPNAFTPNNDGINDAWYVVTNEDCWLEWTVRIYNRWGSVIWVSNNPNDKWIGNTNGGEYYVSDGLYVYQIIAKGKNGRVYTNNGNITVLR